MSALQPLETQDDPDGQPPLPLPAAIDYARIAMAWSREPLPDGLRLAPDQAYGADRLQQFDVYAPQGAHNAPVLVFWHGGGWTNGYRQWVRFLAAQVTDLGVVLVAPSYRLAPTHPLPAAVADALDLLAVVSRHASEWGGAPNQLYLSGHSAGGHLAAMATLCGDGRSRRGVPDDAVKACLPISGILDLHAEAPAPGSLEERVYTHVLQGLDVSQDVVLSPLYWTRGNRVPFDLTVGELDSARVRRSNRRLAAMLQAQQTSVTLEELPGRGHFDTHLDLRDPANPWYQRLIQRVQATT